MRISVFYKVIQMRPQVEF